MNQRSSLPTLFLAIASGLVITVAAGCSRSAPLSPDPVIGGAGADASASASPLGGGQTAQFPILEGAFTITEESGATLTGTYTGTASSNGRKATLTVQVTGGTGAFQGATGALDGRGSGAFVGEGAFSLSLSGTISTNASSRAQFRTSLDGTSSVSCSATGHIVVEQVAGGSGVKTGQLSAILRHEVGNAGCAI
jgi:hypothetical protein